MQLYPHQSEALVQSKDLNRVAYYWDMGLGKTFVGGEKLIQLGARINLVVCQKSKVQDWLEHFSEHYDCRLYDLTRKEDLNNFLHDARNPLVPSIGIINYDLLFRRGDLLTLSGFTLLLDESSLIQNESAKRSKFILKMNPANVILLSGTPVSGKYENLWSQIHLLGWPISNDLYNRQYVNWILTEEDEAGFRHWIVNPDDPYKNVDRLKSKLREHGAFFLKTEECFTLPTQNFVTVHIPTIPQYRKFRKHKVVIAPDGSELIGDTTLTERLPDLHLVVNGISLDVELKAPNGRPTELQKHNIRQINGAGSIAMVLYPRGFEQFKGIVKGVIKCNSAIPALNALKTVPSNIGCDILTDGEPCRQMTRQTP